MTWRRDETGDAHESRHRRTHDGTQDADVTDPSAPPVRTRSSPPAVRRVGGLWQFDPLLQIAVTCTVMLFTARLLGSYLPHLAQRRQALLLSDVLRNTALLSAYARIFLGVWRRPRERRPTLMMTGICLIPTVMLPSMLHGWPGLAAAVVIPAALLTASFRHQQRPSRRRSPLSGIHEPGE